MSVKTTLQEVLAADGWEKFEPQTDPDEEMWVRGNIALHLRYRNGLLHKAWKGLFPTPTQWP